MIYQDRLGTSKSSRQKRACSTQSTRRALLTMTVVVMVVVMVVMVVVVMVVLSQPRYLSPDCITLAFRIARGQVRLHNPGFQDFP